MHRLTYESRCNSGAQMGARGNSGLRMRIACSINIHPRTYQMEDCIRAFSVHTQSSEWKPQVCDVVKNLSDSSLEIKKYLLDFFNRKEIVFYNSLDDLADKILYYKKNDSIRKKIARNGKKKYFKLFNETKITKYILDKSIGNNAKLY